MLEDPRQDVLVHAAGGMIVRRGPDGAIQVAIVFRAIREDWTFPKGKRVPVETVEDVARR